MNIVALIPARAGSKRIPGKNTKLLGGKPLIQWTIEAAVAAHIPVLVCTDDTDAALVASQRDVEYQWRQPVSDDEPDIAWVRRALDRVDCDAFAILRPTSPFRTADTIRRAWAALQRSPADSIRAVEPVRQHPGKMWIRGRVEAGDLPPGCPDCGWIVPLHREFHDDGTPWHSSPTQSLPEAFIQNSSLEMAWKRTVMEQGTIAGEIVLPFFTQGWEGFSIDYPDDWDRAEAHATELLADLQAHSSVN